MTTLIPLTQGKFAVVDDEDFVHLSQWNWFAKKDKNTWYAVRKKRVLGNQQTIFMHREIKQTPDGMLTDHVNGDGLDNRRSNLRVCTNTENARNRGQQKNNTSGEKGVSWHKGHQKWVANIRGGRNRICLGYYHDKKDAALAYDEATQKYFGEFARQL